MADALVVGGGMAGAAAGWHLAGAGLQVTVLEAEQVPGRHATGRSAALFSEYFGNPAVRALTLASRDFLSRPPHGFSAPGTELLRPRGVLALGTPRTAADFEAEKAAGALAPAPAVEIPAREALALVPALRPGAFDRALYRPAVCDMDVAALHHGFLKGLRARGGSVVTRARVTGLAYRGGRWHAATTAGDFTAPLVVNAAGAWADRVAALAGAAPAGLVARRRTAALARVPDETVRDWPMVMDVTETFYARPEPGGLMVSPADATPQEPGDARPDDLDVALGVHRFELMVDLPLRHLPHRWAGLRSSPPDDTPVVGPDPDLPGFCWHAGFGGYGIQTAPAAGALLAALATGAEPPSALAPVTRALRPGRSPRTPAVAAARTGPPHPDPTDLPAPAA